MRVSRKALCRAALDRLAKALQPEKRSIFDDRFGEATPAHPSPSVLGRALPAIPQLLQLAAMAASCLRACAIRSR